MRGGNDNARTFADATHGANACERRALRVNAVRAVTTWRNARLYALRALTRDYRAACSGDKSLSRRFDISHYAAVA